MGDFETDYATAARIHGDFGIRVHGLVESLLTTTGVEVHSVSYRVKEKLSAQKKMARPNSGYNEVEDLHDLLGMRVITYFTDQVDDVAALFEAEFEIDPDLSKDRRATQDPDRFGYVSLHYVAKLSSARSVLPEWAAYKDLRFEVQIRTILQHSWAEIEHDLGYKTAVTIPAHIRRRFSRLAGLLEIADDEFNDIRSDLAAYAIEVTESVQEGESAAIDRDSIRALVLADNVVSEADRAIANLYGAKLVDSVGNRYIASRAQELIEVGFESTGEVLEYLSSIKGKLIAFAAGWLDRGPADGEPDDIDKNGRYTELSPGISLFYLYLHLHLERFGPGEVGRLQLHGDDDGTAEVMSEFHAKIFGQP